MQSTTANLLDRTRQAIQAGRMPDAQQLCNQILQIDSNHAEATHILGFLAHITGNPAEALRLVGRAVELDPLNAVYQQNFGDLLNACGRTDQAAAAYAAAIQADPKLASAPMKLGLLMEQANRLDEAVDLYSRTIALDPNNAVAHCNLGDALFKLHRRDEAMEQYDLALRINPNFAEAYGNRGVLLHSLNRFDEAATDFFRALKIKPDLVSALSSLGHLSRAARRFDDAHRFFSRVAHLRPGSAVAHLDIGNVYHAEGKLEQALDAWRKALQRDPKLVPAYINMGLVQFNLGQYQHAQQTFAAGLSIDPASLELRSNRAMLLLTHGDYEQGWPDYDLRWKLPEFQNVGRKYDSIPRWDGQDLRGKRILVWHEQGIGDTIQFIRYVRPLIDDCGASEVIVAAPASLHRLLQTMPGISRVISPDDPPPDVDFHSPNLRPPVLLKTRLDTIPGQVPYLFAAPELVDRWKQRLGEHTAFRIGIVWEGNRANALNPLRSASLADFRAIAKIPGVKLFSLQKSDAPPEPSLVSGMNLIDLAPELTDFADTAAAIANLDLVISIDSAVVHLTGAMGHNVWTLLSSAPDHRWLLNRSDSPWYPTMRLFRQQNLRQWDSVFEEVRAELAEHVA